MFLHNGLGTRARLEDKPLLLDVSGLLENTKPPLKDNVDGRKVTNEESQQPNQVQSTHLKRFKQKIENLNCLKKVKTCNKNSMAVKTSTVSVSFKDSPSQDSCNVVELLGKKSDKLPINPCCPVCGCNHTSHQIKQHVISQHLSPV